MSTGRLDVAEFSERADRIAAARVRGDLVPIFDDLPLPHPAALETTRPVRPVVKQTIGDRLAASAVPIAAAVAVVLFFTAARGVILVFLLPVVVALLMGMSRGPTR